MTDEQQQPEQERPTTPEPPHDQTEGLNAGGAKALKSEREARKSAEQELKELRQQIAERDRAEVARTTGLPAALVDRLRGNTREELEADARQLADSLNPPNSHRPRERLKGGALPSATPDDTAAIATKILQRGI